MSSYNDDPNPHSQLATKRAVEAYLECLNARSDYIQASSANLGEGTKDLLHQELQNRVLAYFEAMRYNLKTKKSVEEYWDEKTLWTKPQYQYDDHGRVLVDEHGEPLIEEESIDGLKHLDNWFDMSKTETKQVENSFGSGTVVDASVQKIPIDALFNIARLLDEAAEKLGFLAEAKVPVAAPEEAEV